MPLDLRYPNPVCCNLKRAADLINPRYLEEKDATHSYRPILQGFQSAAPFLKDLDIDDTSGRQNYLRDCLYFYNQKTKRLVIMGFDADSTEKALLWVSDKIKYNLNLPVHTDHTFVSLIGNIFNSGIVGIDVKNVSHKTDGNYVGTFTLGRQENLNALVWFVRIAQRLRDTSTHINTSDIKRIFSIGFATAERCCTENGITTWGAVKRILTETIQEQETDLPPHPNADALRCLKTELMSFKQIYAERVTSGKKYLGMFGIFGNFTAQQKLDAVTKFLANKKEPLDAAAREGKLGKLIQKYQETAASLSP